jgi:hypothetical protein
MEDVGLTKYDVCNFAEAIVEWREGKSIFEIDQPITTAAPF